MKIHFGKRLKLVEKVGEKYELTFDDGFKRTASLVFGADGVRSKVRESMFGNLAPEYTGIT